MNPLLKKKFGAFFESTESQLGRTRAVAQQAQSYVDHQTQQDVFKIIFKEIFNDEPTYLTWAYFVRDPQEELDELIKEYSHFVQVTKADTSHILAEIEKKVIAANKIRTKGLTVLSRQLGPIVEQRLGEKITRLKNTTIPNRINALNDLETQGENLLITLGFDHGDIVSLLSAQETAREFITKQYPKIKSGELDDKLFDFLQEQLHRIGTKKQLTTYTQDDLIDMASIIEIIKTCEEEKERIAPISSNLGRFAQKRAHVNVSGGSSETPRSTFYFSEFTNQFYPDIRLPECAEDIEHLTAAIDARTVTIGKIVTELGTSYSELENKHVYHTPITKGDEGMQR